MTKLTAKKELFCKEYLSCKLNATKAAINAGYSKKTARSQGNRLLTNVDIQNRIQILFDKRAEKIELNSEYVLENLQLVAEKCLGRQPSGTKLVEQKNDNGEMVKVEVPTYKFNSLGASRALELLGKNLKLFTDKVEHSGSINLTNLTDEELEAKKRQAEQALKQSTQD